MANTYLQRTPTTRTNNQKFTYSCWFKRSELGTSQYFVINLESGNDRGYVAFDTDNKIFIFDKAGGTERFQATSNFVLRDTSAWYHLVYSVDSTAGSNRVKIYINGVDKYDDFTISVAMSQNSTVGFQQGTVSNSFKVGAQETGSTTFSGLISHINFVDGLQLDASSFGETDTTTGQWKIKTSPSVTYGTNGFFILKDGNSVTDQSGNGNNYTVGNGTLTKTEDNPSNNFATLNPLDNYYANATFSNGNTKITTGTSREASVTATIPMFKGKYYWEAKTLSSSAPFLGIQPIPSFGNTASPAPLQLNGYGLLSTGKVETTNGSGGSIVLATYATYTAGDIIGIAVDLDSAQNKIYFYKNGSILGASGVNITSVGSTSQGMYLVAFGVIAGQDTIEVNFGNGYFGTTAVSSAGTNASGNGIFEYDVPTGYTALSTKGLNL
jgi:hypothetical protein